MCTETSCAGHHMIIVLINLVYAVLATCFWLEPPSNSSGMVKVLTGLSLDDSIEKIEGVMFSGILWDTASFSIMMKEEKWICLSSQSLR